MCAYCNVGLKVPNKSGFWRTRTKSKHERPVGANNLTLRVIMNLPSPKRSLLKVL